MVMVVALFLCLWPCLSLTMPAPLIKLGPRVNPSVAVTPTRFVGGLDTTITHYSHFNFMAQHQHCDGLSQGPHGRARASPLSLLSPPGLERRPVASHALSASLPASSLSSRSLLEHGLYTLLSQSQAKAAAGSSRSAYILSRHRHDSPFELVLRRHGGSAAALMIEPFYFFFDDALNHTSFPSGTDMDCSSVAPPALGAGYTLVSDACSGGAGSTWLPSGLCKLAGLVISTCPTPVYRSDSFRVCPSSTGTWRQGSYYALPMALHSNGLHLADYDSLRRRRRYLKTGPAASNATTFVNYYIWPAQQRFLDFSLCLSLNSIAFSLLLGALQAGLSAHPLALARVGLVTAWLTSWLTNHGFLIPYIYYSIRDSASKTLRVWRALPDHASVILFWFVLVTQFGAADAVCFSCNGNDPNCPGDNTCAMAKALAANVLVMTGGAAAATALDMGSNGKPILPLTWLQVLKPSVLDALVALAKRKPLGTPTAIRDLSLSALLDSLISGAIPQGDARFELARRVTATATSADEKAQIKLVCEVLPKSGEDFPSNGGNKFAGAGALQYVYAIAMRIVRHLLDPSKITVAGSSGSAAASSSTAATLTSIDLKRPKTVFEFLHSLTVWQSVLSAVGLSSAVVLGPFVSDVVHLPMLDHGWEVALEHFLLYIQKIDSGCGWELASATAQGSQDTFLNRAIKLAPSPVVPKGVTPGLKPLGSDKPPSGDSPPPGQSGVFNGKSNTDPSAKPCAAFNTGSEHRRCRPDGSCPFRHACDQWISGKGPGARCGSTSHNRLNCTNAAKVADKVE